MAFHDEEMDEEVLWRGSRGNVEITLVTLSAGYGVLMNLATKARPDDFSVIRCTTPKAPLPNSSCTS